MAWSRGRRESRASHDESISTPPQFLSELHAWIHDRLRLEPSLEAQLLAAIDGVFLSHERRWQAAKQEAVEVVSATFVEKMARLERELSAKDKAVHSISRYFENLVSDLTDKSQRDPKTTLMNFSRFTERLELFLALEQRGTWCAVGLADITGFKWYNDTFGHAVGDRIIKRVAHLLREQVRSDALIAQDHRDGRRDGSDSPDSVLHARLGGDEFCFLVPDLDTARHAFAVADRFRDAIARYDWAQENSELTGLTVQVDVGVVCLRLGSVADRRAIAGDLASALIERADKLMYSAKEQRTSHIAMTRLRIAEGQLADDDDDGEEC